MSYCVTRGKTLAKTVQERQKDYRNSRPHAGNNGERRLNTWVTSAAAYALSRLACRYGVTNREMLERLIIEADKKVCDASDPDSTEWDEYFRAGMLRSNKRIRAMERRQNELDLTSAAFLE